MRLFVFLISLIVVSISIAQDQSPSVAAGVPAGPKFWTYKQQGQEDELGNSFTVHPERYWYFIDTILNRSPVAGGDYVEAPSLVEDDHAMFEKILALKNLDKSQREKIALDRINRFLSTNYRNQTMPAQMYSGKQPLASPFYLSELKTWTFGAVAKGDLDVLRAFLDSYNLLHIKNEEGYNLLLHSILHGQYDIAEFLIRRGINVNEVNKYGVSALMIAARNNDIRAIKLLVKYKPKLYLKDRFGNNALSYALMNNNQDVHKLLSSLSSKAVAQSE